MTRNFCSYTMSFQWCIASNGNGWILPIVKILINILNNFQNNNKDRVFLFKSLGQLRFLSAIKHCIAVIGNSSSGLIEAPSFGVPTLNIGDRQKGRLSGGTVINCDSTQSSILEGLNKILSPEFIQACKKEDNPYGSGDVSKKIVSKLLSYPLEGLIKKQFYNIGREKWK